MVNALIGMASIVAGVAVAVTGGSPAIAALAVVAGVFCLTAPA